MSEKLRAGQRAPAGRMGQPVGETHIEDSPPAPALAGGAQPGVHPAGGMAALAADGGRALTPEWAFRREEQQPDGGPVGDPGDL